MNSSSNRRFAIIGGGISGLAAAQRIIENHPAAELTLYEGSPRLGGIIQSTRRDGYLFEHAADCFIVTPDLPWAGELCKQLGMELIETSTGNRGAAVLRNGRLYPVPTGLQLMAIHRIAPLLRSPLLSWPGKLRVLAERFVPPKTNAEEESLGQFTRRRYGKEMFEQIVQPLVSGIYTADPERLSMAAALPQFVRQEQEYGSLMKAARRSGQDQNAQGARYALFRAPKDGMQSLIDTLDQHLRDRGVQIRCSTQVTNVDREQGKWKVVCSDELSETYDGVIVATSIQAVPKLVGRTTSQLARLTEAVEHVGTAIICLGYHVDQLARPLTCFGSVIPHVEGRKILAVSHTNVKFPDRAPADHVLLRVFVGGALQPEMLDLSDAELLQCARAELGQIMGVTGEPKTHMIVRWPRTTPQYNLGHRDIVRAIHDEVATMPAFEIANNALNGVGIPQCVRGGWAAADRLMHESRGAIDSSVDADDGIPTIE